MKSIILSADDKIIDSLHRIAQERKTTVNDIVGEWAEDLVAKENKVKIKCRLDGFQKSVEKFSFNSNGQKLTREEMNER